METITRITPKLIAVKIIKVTNTVDSKDYDINEYEFRNLQVEVAQGLWTNYAIIYIGEYDGEVEYGTINSDGSITQPLDVLNMNTDYQFELLKLKNCH